MQFVTFFVVSLLLGTIFHHPSNAGEGTTTKLGEKTVTCKRFLLNNDGTNLFWRKDLSMEMVEKHVAECPAEITTYLLCPNGIQKMMYPSAHEELATRGGLPTLVEAGEDPFGTFLTGLKKRGFETFVTFRMNEVHNVNNPEDPDLTAFWRKHPEYRVERGKDPGNWMAQCLDYSLEPVKEYNLRLLTEILEKYQPDGIELDWMRFLRHLSGNAEEVWSKRGHLTELVERVRSAADKVAKEAGHSILVAVRVPTSMEGCRRLGVDLVEWNKRELVDFITAAPFLSTDFTMPIREMREALSDRPIPIYAGMEFGYAGNPHSEESIRAAALGLHDSGADGIYVFNFPCWREHHPDPPWKWIPQLRDPKLMAGKDLVFPVLSGQHRVSGIDLPTQLPKTLQPGKTAELEFNLPRYVFETSELPAKAELQIISDASCEVCINGTLQKGNQVPVNLLKAGVNEVVVKIVAKEAAELQRVELSFIYE